MRKAILFVFLIKIIYLYGCGGGEGISEFKSGDEIYIEMLGNKLEDDSPGGLLENIDATFHFNFVRRENSYTHEYKYDIYLPIYSNNCFYEFIDDSLTVYVDGELLKLEITYYSEPKYHEDRSFYGYHPYSVYAFYKIDKKDMEKISNAKDLRVRLNVILNTSDKRESIYVNLYATEENFIRFRDFVSKYLK
ncbi:MAG: hypothetical protein N2490_02140 [Ignavibacteria bacterium]|nr:hypothetical protein [Ignavibacteria bacterium]